MSAFPSPLPRLRDHRFNYCAAARRDAPGSQPGEKASNVKILFCLGGPPRVKVISGAQLLRREREREQKESNTNSSTTHKKRFFGTNGQGILQVL